MKRKSGRGCLVSLNVLKSVEDLYYEQKLKKERDELLLRDKMAREMQNIKFQTNKQ